jgi:hypothetical protein
MLVALVAVVSFAVLVVLPPVFFALLLRVFAEECPAPRVRPVALVRREPSSPTPYAILS